MQVWSDRSTQQGSHNTRWQRSNDELTSLFHPPSDRKTRRIFPDNPMANHVSPRHLQLLPGFIVLAFLCLLYRILALSSSRRKFIQENACKPPPAYPHKDPILGLDSVRDAISAARSKTAISRQLRQYAQFGNTFSSRFFLTPVISTIEPENIQTVLASRFDDFGIGSRRKDAFAPLLGRGIFQVDGPQWKHSRSLLRLCFTRSQVEDLSTFNVHVGNLIKAISKDGSIIDLEKLFPRLAADVTTDCMFGQSLGFLKDPSPLQNDFVEAMHESQVGCEERWKMGAFAHVIPQRAFYESVKRVHDFMD